MKKLVNVIKSDNNNLLLLSVLVVAVLVATIIGRAPAWNALTFLLAQICFLYLPGKALLNIGKTKIANGLTNDFLSYAIGYALSIVLYFAFLVIGIQKYILYLYIPVFIFSIVYLFNDSRRNGGLSLQYNWQEKKWFSIILALAVCVGVLLFECVNLSPKLYADGVNVTIDQDLMFWLRNSIAASISYPLPDLSVLGNQFFYHYFSSIEMAFLHYTTGIGFYDLCFTYSYLITIFLLSSGLYVIGKEYIKTSEFVICFLSIILLTCSFESLTDIYFTYHIFIGSFGLSEGLAFFCYSLFVYKMMEKANFGGIKESMLFVLLFFVLVGLKAPIAMLLMLGIGIKCMFLFFKEKGKGRIVLFSLMMFIVFSVVFVFIISGNIFTQTIQHGSNMDMYPSLTSTLLHPKSFNDIVNYCSSINIPFFIYYPILLLFYCILALFIPICVLLISSNKGKRYFSFLSNVDVVSIIITGLCLCLFIGHKGMSQMYFVFPSFILIPLLSFSSLSNAVTFTEVKKTLLLIFVIGVLIFGMQNGRKGIQGLKSIAKTSIFKERGMCANDPTDGRTLTKLEVEGLLWIKDNVKDNSVLLSNKLFANRMSDVYKLDSLMQIPVSEDNSILVSEELLSIHSCRTTVVSCITERQTYMEGYYFSNMDIKDIQQRASEIYEFYHGNESMREFLMSKGVSYAVVFRNIQPNLFPGGCKIVFENPELQVVKL